MGTVEIYVVDMFALCLNWTCQPSEYRNREPILVVLSNKTWFWERYSFISYLKKKKRKGHGIKNLDWSGLRTAADMKK